MKRTYIESHIFKAFSKMNGIIPQDEAGIILSGLVFIKLYSSETWEKLKELNDYSINLYIHDFFTNEKLPFNRIYDFKELDSKLLKALIIILDEADISIREMFWEKFIIFVNLMIIEKYMESIILPIM